MVHVSWVLLFLTYTKFVFSMVSQLSVTSWLRLISIIQQCTVSSVWLWLMITKGHSSKWCVWFGRVLYFRYCAIIKLPVIKIIICNCILLAVKFSGLWFFLTFIFHTLIPNLLELELKIVVSCHVGAWNWTRAPNC